jgi:protein-tyrosine-phosphatase
MTNEEQLLTRIRESLIERFEGLVDAATIERQVADCYQAMSHTARIKKFLPVMAENMAIRELNRIVSTPSAPGARVLFLSRHDAGRSQMAVALMDRAWLHAVHPVHAESAGAEPTARVEPVVVAAMDEIGIDLRIDHPRLVTPALIDAADLVVRTDASCVLPDGKRHLDWDLPDPARRPLAEVRRLRDDIDRRVQGLLADLLEAG